MPTKTVELLSPIPFAGTMVASLTLREPRMKELVAFGEPSILTRTAEGGIVFVENIDAIAGYLRALLPAEQSGVIDHVGLADSLKLKTAILDFFANARQAGVPPAPDSLSPTSTGSEPEISPD